MKLFDILAGSVAIHEDALAIPAFRKIWELDKDKKHATDILSYIVLQNKWNSPYVTSIIDENERARRLKQQFFNDPNYSLTIEEKLAEDEFNFLQNTSTLQLLNNIRLKLNSISAYYKDSLDEELNEKKIKDLLAGMANADKVLESIEHLEDRVKAEESMKSKKVRGDAKINPFELPTQNVNK